MLAKKKKLSKKEIKQDKLVTTYYQVIEFYEEYKNYIIYGLGGIAAIIVAILIYTTNLEESNTAANKALAKIIPVYDSGNYQEAINGQPGTTLIGLKQIVEQYSGTKNGEFAKLYLANAYYFIGEYKSALEVYEDFDAEDDILKATAIAGAANCYEELKDYQKAAEKYEEAASLSEHNTQNAEYLLRATANYIAVGDKNSAKDMLDRLKKDYQKSAAYRESERYRAQLTM